MSIGEQVNCTRGNHQLETDISESLEVHEYRTCSVECNARHRWNGREACSAFFVKIEQASAYQYCSVRRREQKARCLLLQDEEAAFRLSIGEQEIFRSEVG